MTKQSNIGRLTAFALVAALLLPNATARSELRDSGTEVFEPRFAVESIGLETSETDKIASDSAVVWLHLTEVPGHAQISAIFSVIRPTNRISSKICVYSTQETLLLSSPW